MTTRPLPQPLLDYASRLLLGTGLTGADAEPLAADTRADEPDTARAAAEALRDGWRTATEAGAR